eukprot:gene13928-biopygen13973
MTMLFKGGTTTVSLSMIGMVEYRIPFRYKLMTSGLGRTQARHSPRISSLCGLDWCDPEELLNVRRHLSNAPDSTESGVDPPPMEAFVPSSLGALRGCGCSLRIVSSTSISRGVHSLLMRSGVAMIITFHQGSSTKSLRTAVGSTLGPFKRNIFFALTRFMMSMYWFLPIPVSRRQSTAVKLGSVSYDFSDLTMSFRISR